MDKPFTEMENINNVQGQLFHHYSKAKSRIFFIDYDGTLVPFAAQPHQAVPSASVIELLAELVKDSSNRVVIISGREKETLEEWFGDLPLTLAAEHGAFYKIAKQPWQSYFSTATAWKDKVLGSLRGLVFQYEGSFIEEKNFSIAWHYRAIAHKITEAEKKQILAAFHSIQTHNEFLVYEEDCTIEFRANGIDKGKFTELYLGAHERYDFVLAIGDGRTDEDMFEVMGEDTYSIKVGKPANSVARYFIERQDGVLNFFSKIVNFKIND